MKWIEPDHGTLRIVRRFLFLPIVPTDEDEGRWLERAYIKQEYRRGGYWRNIRWATKEEYDAAR